MPVRLSLNTYRYLLLLYSSALLPTTAPTHGRIIANFEILGYLRQCPVATPLNRIQRYFARLILPTSRTAKDLFAVSLCTHP